MHLGFDSYVCGETITTNLESDDVLIIASGSGETGSLVSMAKKAVSIGAKILTVTVLPNGTIGQLADLAVRVPAPTHKM